MGLKKKIHAPKIFHPPPPPPVISNGPSKNKQHAQLSSSWHFFQEISFTRLKKPLRNDRN